MPKTKSVTSKSLVSTQPPLIPAVGYTRRSTDKQETSIAEQVKAVQQYADDKGYKIIRWYTDDAISGDDTENRHAFQQMLTDAQQKHDYEVIVCWDQSRFGRFSPQEAGHWTYMFAQAKVRLVTTDKGPIDWNDFTGWLTYSVDQHAKHQYIVNLSRDVVRGQLEAAKKGSWLGAPPYGYRIEGERKNKRLAVDDVGKVKVVQRIFREFVEEGRSMSDIAKRLHEEGFVPPGSRGRPWRFDAVRIILENPAYVGDYASGRRSYGKYHIAREGQVAKGNGGGGRTKNPESQWIVRRDTHEGIIDRNTFERAQAILAKGKTGRSQYTPENNPFVLSGLLRCGKCGCPLWGDRTGSRQYYRCSNWQYNGAKACDGTKVSEVTILNGVADHLENWLGFSDPEREGSLDMAAVHGVLKPQDLPEAFEKVKKLVMPPPVPKHDAKRLEKQAEQLRGKITKARANLVLLDPENIPGAQDRIRQLDAELGGVELELGQVSRRSSETLTR